MNVHSNGRTIDLSAFEVRPKLMKMLKVGFIASDLP
jgi:hypothetical protein